MIFLCLGFSLLLRSLFLLSAVFRFLIPFYTSLLQILFLIPLYFLFFSVFSLLSYLFTFLIKKIPFLPVYNFLSFVFFYSFCGYSLFLSSPQIRASYFYCFLSYFYTLSLLFTYSLFYFLITLLSMSQLTSQNDTFLRFSSVAPGWISKPPSYSTLHILRYTYQYFSLLLPPSTPSLSLFSRITVAIQSTPNLYPPVPNPSFSLNNA